MPKMRANPKLEHKPHSFSCMGEAFVPDDDGWIDIPKVMMETARAHGFITADDFGVHVAGIKKVSKDLTKGMTRRQMMTYCIMNDLDIPEGLSVEGMRQFVSNHMSSDDEEAA